VIRPVKEAEANRMILNRGVELDRQFGPADLDYALPDRSRCHYFLSGVHSTQNISAPAALTQSMQRMRSHAAQWVTTARACVVSHATQISSSPWSQ
jgi:hypothetical protein